MTVNAQSGKGSFAGRVVDKDTKQPVGYAAVRLLTLPDSTFLAGVATTDDGKFRMPVVWPKDKKLLLEISFIGYTTFSKSIPSSFRGTSQNLGDIALFSDGILLGETVVVGKAPLAVTEQDTTVFNASAYRTPEGSMLEDLVKQLPGGEIDGDGKLLIHGKEVKKILVDGKEFFADDPKAALKNLPVEMVEKLRAYERKSDLARLTGIDDGDEEMILDLGVKKDMKKGWMDNFMAGTGNKGRYELANTLNRFRDNSQLTIIGNLNNTNNQGFSELQRESSAASGNILNRVGLVTSHSLGMNFTHDWDRVKLRSNVQYTGTDRSEDNSTTVDNFLKQDKSISHSTNSNHMKNHNLTANAYLEWKIDSVTNLVFRPQYRYVASDRRNSGYQQSWSDETLLNERTASNLYDNSQYNLTFMLQVNRKFSRKGRNLALKVDYGTNTSSADRKNFSTTHYFKNDTEKVVNQRVDDEGDGYNYRLQLVYVEPLPNRYFLQFRYSYQYRVTNSDRFVYNWDEAMEDYRGKGRQPSVRDLQPVADMTNPLNIRIGNPSLKPSYTNTFTLNYNSYNVKHQRNMVVSLFVENVLNSVTNQVTYDSETGGRTTMPVNLNGNWRASGALSLSGPFKNRNWLFRTYSYLQYRNQNGYTTQNKEEPMKSSVKHLTARERLQFTFRTRQLELSARGEVLYNNSYNNVKDMRTETFDYQLGGDLQYYLPWGFECSSDLTYFLRTGYGYDSSGRKNLIWNCQLSKAFLKKKQLLLRFKFYDILRQEISMVRTISATAIRDADYNVLGRYFMVHAILRLNMMGKK
nr:outer membrane beta-barrel protein [Bacteroides cellulosilyticus]